MSLTARGATHVYAAGTPYAQTGVEGVDLDVEKGSLLLVLGPTGSGKSTLLRMLAGLLPATAGEVRADGALLGARASIPAGKVGLVFQRPESQLFAEDVLSDVGFGPKNLGLSDAEADEAAKEALRAVGLDPEDFGPRSPFGLSGGEARRVAIAGVLAMRPGYLLLDEPTAGLDAPGRESVLAAIGRARSASGVVVVSHDAEQFLHSAQRVLLLSAGRPSFLGSQKELLADTGVFGEAGLEAPDILRTQQLAEERGLRLRRHHADVESAGRALAEAAGWTS